MKTEKLIFYSIMVVLTVFSFGLSFYYINLSLHYHFQQIVWESTGLFLKHYSTYAGGIGEYLSLFVSQFFYFNSIGSIIVSLVAFFIAFLMYKTLRLKTGNVMFVNLIIPVLQIIFLALLFDYKYPFSVTINLLIVSLFLYFSTKFENKSKYNIPISTIIIGALIYYLSGGMFFLVFMSSSFILSIEFNKKHLIKAIVIVFVTFLIPAISYKFIYLSSFKSSFFHSTPDVAVMLRYGKPLLFYIGLGMIPVAILISKLMSLNIFRRKIIKNENYGKLKGSKQPGNLQKGNKRWNVGFGVAMAVLIGVSFFILKNVWQPQEKLEIEIDYNASRGNWDKVLQLCEKLDSYDRMSNFQYNRALAHKGELLEKVFHFEQLLGSQGLFMDRPFNAEVTLPNSDVYFDLGNIDESLRYAFEAQTLIAKSPRVLKRLILNCIILDKWDAANTYINVLSANPMEKKWVEKYRTYFINPNLANTDEMIVEKRNDRNKTEGFFVIPRTKLISLMQQNPLNKPAFEYLIAFDLMEHDLTSLIEDMEFITPLKYKKMPTVLEEAILLFRSQKRDNKFLNQFRISAPVLERFRKFAALTVASKGDKNKAKQTTLEYKDTYWYYALFLSPLVTKVSIETKPVDANY